MAENEEIKVTEEVTEEAPKAKKAKKAAAKKEVVKEEVKPEPVKEEKPAVTEATAKLCNFGVTPRKVRLVIDLIRGKDIADAYAILDNCQKACAPAIKKLVASAVANAVNNFNMPEDTLYIAAITANDAMKLKRILPRAKGSASGLVKRWSHVYVTVKNREVK